MGSREGRAITVGLHLLPANYPGVTPNHMAETEGVKEQMDELHLRKIDLADEILVVNVDGYIGNSTKREIEYAHSIGKRVKWCYELRCHRCGFLGHVLTDGLCPPCVDELLHGE